MFGFLSKVSDFLLRARFARWCFLVVSFVGLEIKSNKIINKYHNVQHLRYGKVGRAVSNNEIDAVTDKERQLHNLNDCYQRFHETRYLAQLIEGAEKVIKVHNDVNDVICYRMHDPHWF